jgi:hypothetical protein
VRAGDGGLAGEVDRGPVERLAASVDGVRRAVAGVDEVLTLMPPRSREAAVRGVGDAA